MHPFPTNCPVGQGVTFINEVQTSGWGEALKSSSMDEDEAQQWWDWYKREVCAPWVIREGVDEIEEIPGAEGSAQPVAELPLIVREVDEVEFGGQVFRPTEDGLYRFIEMTRSVRNLIVARDGHWLPMLQGVSGLQVHGNKEKDKPEDELKEALRTCSFVCIICGNIAALTASVLKDGGFETRLVGGLSTEDWNTYDNGHALFELYCPRTEKWVLADPDMGMLFRDQGVFLDAGEVWKCLQEAGPVELVPLARKHVDPFFCSPSGFNYFMRFRWQWQSEEDKLAWYRRILQCVSVEEGGARVHVGDREKINEYLGEGAVEVLPYEEFRARVYK